jgi:acetoacetate decarboxylase
VVVKGAWSGPAALHLIPHAMAPVADLPVQGIISASHIITDLILPYGKVVMDYLKD